jgi:hypothetical protein
LDVFIYLFISCEYLSPTLFVPSSHVSFVFIMISLNVNNFLHVIIFIFFVCEATDSQTGEAMKRSGSLKEDMEKKCFHYFIRLRNKIKKFFLSEKKKL